MFHPEHRRRATSWERHGNVGSAHMPSPARGRCGNKGIHAAVRHIHHLTRILTEFRGRIDRQAFFIGILVVAAAYLFSPFRPPSVDGLAGPPTIMSELWNYAWLIPLAAVVVKRVNDIGWPCWLGYAYAAIVGLSFIPWSIGVLPMRPEETPAVASSAIKALLLVELLGFAACAFVPGDWRPSRYGEQAFLRAAGVESKPSARQGTPARASAKLIWGLYIGSLASFGLSAVVGCVIALLRRKELEGTPYESHARTAMKVFTYSLFTALIVGGVGAPLLMKMALGNPAATHAVDAGLAMFMVGLLLVWLPGWGIVGLMRALKGRPIGS